MDILPPVPKTKKPFRLGRCETLSGGRSGIQCSASSLIDEMASCYSSSLPSYTLDHFFQPAIDHDTCTNFEQSLIMHQLRNDD